MPTKKPSTKAKTSKKSPSRLDRVIKKLNLARPRNQFIVAFLVVGLLGGGYFAYQSFAATQSWTYSNFDGSQSQLGPQNVSVQPSVNCAINMNYKEVQKNSQNVTAVLCPKSQPFRNASGLYSWAGVYVKGSYIGSWGLNRNFRTCAWVRGYGPGVESRFYLGLQYGGTSNYWQYAHDYTQNAPSDKYRYVCGRWITVRNIGPIWPLTGVLTSNTMPTSGFISSVVLEMQ
jgi:hypothetical protein